MCSQKIAKCLLLVFNFFFLLGGAAALGVGIMIQIDDFIGDVVSIAEDLNIYAGSYVLIAGGAVMMIVGLIGCLGAKKESQCFLGIYFLFLVLLFALELGIAVWALVERESLQEKVNESLSGTDPHDSRYQALQKHFKCCGQKTVCDGFKSTDMYAGCRCTGHHDNCDTFIGDGTCPTSQYDIYTTPCDEAVKDYVEDNITIIAAVTLAVAVVELIGMVLSMCLCCSIRKGSSQRY